MTIPEGLIKPCTVLLGMSGGVDSSVAAFLLREQGFNVIGLTLITHDHADESLADAEAVANQLGISWRSIDVREPFKELVVDDFVNAYMQGRTPNPCVVCNPMVKFKTLETYAKDHDIHSIATGHYAEIRQMPNGRMTLAKSRSGIKDQSYFMYRLTQQQLACLIFPLAGHSKADVRAIAAKAGLNAPGGDLSGKPDSQDCCFIPQGNYADYIRENLIDRGLFADETLTKPGPVVNTSGCKIGTHKGLIHYTIGQRKGFSVQTTDRLFVVGRDIASNTLIVGLFNEVLKKEIRVIDPVYSGMAFIPSGERLEARIRNSASEVPCTVYQDGEDALRVVFDQEVAAPAPGQSCVFYREGRIMAGGFISL